MDVPTKSAKLALFAHSELDLLISELYTEGVEASAFRVLGALVLAARRSPMEAIAAIYSTYVEREAAEAAKLAAAAAGSEDDGEEPA